MDFDKNLLQVAIDIAKSSGAKDVIAKMTLGKEYQIRFSNSAIDLSTQWNRDVLELFLSIGRRVDVISIPNPTESILKQDIPKAVEKLRSASRTLLYWGMYRKRAESKPLESIYDSKIEDFYEKSPELVNTAIQTSINSGSKKVAGVLYFGNLKLGVLTSFGNGGIYNSSYYQFSIRSFVDPLSSGQDVVVGRSLTNIEKKMANAGENSSKIAKMAVGNQQGQPGTYDLIMSPIVAANVFNYLTDGANPVYIIGKMSCLGKSMNKMIGPENLTISDDPTIEDGLYSRPFDYEGVPSQKTPLIKNGKMVGLIHNTTSAFLWRLLLKFGSRTTGNSYLGSAVLDEYGPKVLAPLPTNTVYEPGDYSLEEMISESKRPTIYVTSNWYTRFTSMVEGIFSTIPRDGIFLIENGQITKPICKIRIADNLLRMMKNIIAIGKDVKQIKWWEVEHPAFIPTIKIKDVPITSASK